MAYSQKYTLIHLLDDMPDGTEYHWKDWPLHVTVADVFAIDWDVPTMVQKLTTLLENRTPATAIAGGDTYLGPAKTKVVLLDPSKELLALHSDIVGLLEQGNVRFNNPQFIRQGFLAHSTVQSHARLHKGDVVTFDTLSLVDMFPHRDPYQRNIIRTVKLRDV